MTRNPRANSPSDTNVYRLRMQLAGASKPEIWRIAEAPGCITLFELHHIIQAVMGWENGHLHCFVIRGKDYGATDPWGEQDYRSQEERATLLRAAPKAGTVLQYEYDLGNSWLHVITVENISPPETKAKYPRCVAGEGACPPEDCGGVARYGSLLQALQKPSRRGHREAVEVLGRGFDPEAFSLRKANARLRKIWEYLHPDPTH